VAPVVKMNRIKILGLVICCNSQVMILLELLQAMVDNFSLASIQASLL